MHETSLVRSLLTQVEELLHEHCGAAVERITVEIGPLSGVEPLLVQDAFQQLAQASRATARATLQIEETALEAECSNCRGEFEIPSFRFECPACGSKAVHVTRGDEFRLISIEIATADTNACQA